jgi:hypothetical protein
MGEDLSENLEYEPSKTAVEIGARAIEAQICSRYEWTDEQFEIWWTKDPRNRNKDERREQARWMLKALNEAGYDLSETAVVPPVPSRAP